MYLNIIIIVLTLMTSFGDVKESLVFFFIFPAGVEYFHFYGGFTFSNPSVTIHYQKASLELMRMKNKKVMCMICLLNSTHAPFFTRISYNFSQQYSPISPMVSSIPPCNMFAKRDSFGIQRKYFLPHFPPMNLQCNFHQKCMIFS